MAVLDTITATAPVSSPSFWAVVTAVALFAYYGVPYLQNSLKLNRFPGPVTAKFSYFWPLLQQRMHRWSWSIDEQHQKHGDFVRISPDQVSVNHPDAIKEIMGHGSGFRKSEFYYAFDNIEDGIFTTRDPAKHTRKRKFVAHVFSPKAMLDFEPYITNHLTNFARQMDTLIDTGKAGAYLSLGAADPEVRQRQRQGEAALDASKWAAYLAFDIIGDLAFGDPFGFVLKGYDPDDGIRKLRDRGEWCATVGQMPWIKLWTSYFYFDNFFRQGLKAAQALGKKGVVAVDKRKLSKSDPNRKDILYYLLNAVDPNTGGPIPDKELKAEAVTQLIAGSDSTGNTITHLLDMTIRHPDKVKKLQDEVDAAFPSPLPEDFVAPFSECKDLPYVDAVIHEVLRLRTTSSVGLPRVVRKGGATVAGQWFEEDTVVSVPTYSTHRDPRIWGEDALEFRPERWLGDAKHELEKYFLGFSTGPRACIGRNVAYMELKKTVATLFRRFEYRLVYPEREAPIREGFHYKCKTCPVYISKRPR